MNNQEIVPSKEIETAPFTRPVRFSTKREAHTYLYGEPVFDKNLRPLTFEEGYVAKQSPFAEYLVRSRPPQKIRNLEDAKYFLRGGAASEPRGQQNEAPRLLPPWGTDSRKHQKVLEPLPSWGAAEESLKSAKDGPDLLEVKEKASEKMKPRDIRQLTMDYFTYERNMQLKVDAVPFLEKEPLKLHEGFVLNENAPEEFVDMLEGFKKEANKLHMQIAEYEYILSEAKEDRNEFQLASKEAEEKKDYTLAAIHNTEANIFKEHIVRQLAALKRSKKLLSDKSFWDTELLENAGLFKRAQELLEKITKVSIPKSGSDESFMQFAEDSREFSNLMKSRRFSVGDKNLKFYLYKHPNVRSDHRFEALPAEPD